ncbi:peroxisomal acyl-CoA oxidase (macronuclear) [Tetrahymena thermophila SB210]|uniref:Acyl-coenzyme A oxidase n=1 Tax=Tetrahymena thermophila (strain SB210) TaxID=312017 RepID=Q23PV4_TETTS|nr:peroxisomal acyl-CoA oxidase [Tetrahymena thermophila SB210]EAR98581.2 peroxisomal acyl-CoA oxidase [Tetrahymena thermophila SB210]|eukprot:XP_001018826.2 peroxisomal acyl-CoA oxidase [Tetrahymena thermophila SB210]
MDPEFLRELERASVKIEDLEEVAYKNKEQARHIKNDYLIIQNNKELQLDPNYYNLSRIEQIKYSARKFVEFITFDNQRQNVNEPQTIMNMFIQFPFSFPSGVHQVMFVPCIKYLASDKQCKDWLPRIYSYEIVGCYCQTELGHGSDVQSLETTATYDPETQEFIINSPTPTSTKWWVGELGIWCTHAMVFAQLNLLGKNYGVHSFLVPIRDIKTRKPLPGITVGDIGPKVGFNVKDNGFVRFNNVRIPRENMLMRYAKVSKAGIFSQPGNAKIGYAVMLQTRLAISCFFPRTLTQALNVAIRYSILRKQFNDSSNQERKILDYQTQQEKLLIPLAEIYGILISSYTIWDLNDDLLNRVQKDDFSTLNEMHVVVSGAKATWTETTLYYLEQCRLACGGHGFHHYSGIPGMIQEWKPMVTLEGENTVLHMQVARFLLKQYEKAMKGLNIGFSVQYLKQASEFLGSKLENVNSVGELRNIEVLRKIMIASAVFAIQNAADKMLKHVSDGKPPKQAWDEYAGIDLVEASKAHINLFTMNNYVEFVHRQTKENVKNLVMKLCILNAVSRITQKPYLLIENNYLEPKHFTFLTQLRDEMLLEVRRDALPLVEAFGFQDSQLRSAIALTSGKPYETLYDWAKNKNEMNNSYFAEGYEWIQKMQNLHPKL